MGSRKKPWPTYDKGDVMIDETDVLSAVRVVKSKLLFRYDQRAYHDTETGKFEMLLTKYFGVKHALAVSSGTAAIALPLMAYGLKPGDAVACPAFAFAATPSAILLAGGTPVLIEVDNNLHMDVDDLRGKVIDFDLKAIVVVHMRGFASDIEEIVNIANEFNIPVIEDSVPSMGVKFKGKYLGTFGISGAFSTQSDKTLNTGEGGFVLMNDSELYYKAIAISGAYENRVLKHFSGSEVPNMPKDVMFPLYNFRMDEIRAAIAANQMLKIQSRLEKAKKNYDYVKAHLQNIEQVVLRKPVVEGTYLGDTMQLSLVNGSRVSPKEFASTLCKHGVDARALGDDDVNVRRYWDWKFLFPGKNIQEIKALLPSSKKYLEKTIDIPLSPLLDQSDLDYLIDIVEKTVSDSEYSNHYSSLTSLKVS